MLLYLDKEYRKITAVAQGKGATTSMRADFGGPLPMNTQMSLVNLSAKTMKTVKITIKI
jgi:hypothetical protein